jgi:hypothetical protein
MDWRIFFETTFADLGVLVAMTGMLVFVVSYSSAFNWRKTAEGRAVMYVFVALILLAFSGLIVVLFGPLYALRWIVRPLVWWLVAGAMIRICVVLWRARHRPDDDDSEPLNIDLKQRKEKE